MPLLKPMAGHFGIHKTFALISRRYSWPRLRHFVTDYVHSCDSCCQSRIHWHHRYGLLQPMPIHESPWKSISLDFITDLPPSKGFDVILTVVDCFTKMAHFLPCTKRQLIYSCGRCSDTMVFQMILSVIWVPSSSQNFGPHVQNCGFACRIQSYNGRIHITPLDKLG